MKVLSLCVLSLLFILSTCCHQCTSMKTDEHKTSADHHNETFAEAEMGTIVKMFPETKAFTQETQMCNPHLYQLCYSVPIAPLTAPMMLDITKEHVFYGGRPKLFSKMQQRIRRPKKPKVAVTLRVSIPRQYPQRSPVFALVDKRGLNNEELRKLQIELQKIARQFRRRPCVRFLTKRVLQFVSNDTDVCRRTVVTIPFELVVFVLLIAFAIHFHATFCRRAQE